MCDRVILSTMFEVIFITWGAKYQKYVLENEVEINLDGGGGGWDLMPHDQVASWVQFPWLVES